MGREDDDDDDDDDGGGEEEEEEADGEEEEVGGQIWKGRNEETKALLHRDLPNTLITSMPHEQIRKAVRRLFVCEEKNGPRMCVGLSS